MIFAKLLKTELSRFESHTHNNLQDDFVSDLIISVGVWSGFKTAQKYRHFFANYFQF